MAALLALGASVVWGVADFVGGTLTRRLPAYVVILGSQVSATLVVGLAALVTSGFRAPGRYLFWGALAGVAGTLGLAAFYKALAIGTMGIVAPIAGTGAAVPVVVGLLQGERPTAVQLVGIGLAIVGIVLASGPELRVGGAARVAVALAFGTAFAFGTVLVALAEGSRTSVVMTMLVMRLVTCVVAFAAFVALRSPVRPQRADIRTLVVVGVGDAVAVGAYSVATTRGLVSVVAVLASLYPVTTALLARQVHGERLRRVQIAGVGVVLAGVVALTGGG